MQNFCLYSIWFLKRSGFILFDRLLWIPINSYKYKERQSCFKPDFFLFSKLYVNKTWSWTSFVYILKFYEFCILNITRRLLRSLTFQMNFSNTPIKHYIHQKWKKKNNKIWTFSAQIGVMVLYFKTLWW